MVTVVEVVPVLVVVAFIIAPSAMMIASIRVTDGLMYMLPPVFVVVFFRAMRMRVLSVPE